MIVLLDSGPLGILSNPNSSPTVQACQIWAEKLIIKRHEIIVPEIADYEVRRELLRANKQSGLRRLDRVKTRFRYLPLTTKTMLKAAELWAEARRSGKPTASPDSLDGDVILAAQAYLIIMEEVADRIPVIIATTNVNHLERFTIARIWQDIE